MLRGGGASMTRRSRGPSLAGPLQVSQRPPGSGYHGDTTPILQPARISFTTYKEVFCL